MGLSVHRAVTLLVIPCAVGFLWFPQLLREHLRSPRAHLPQTLLQLRVQDKQRGLLGLEPCAELAELKQHIIFVGATATARMDSGLVVDIGKG